MDATRYAFITEWVDTIASQVRKYTVCFYPSDNSVEMIDNKQKKLMLRRTVVANKLSEFFLGGAVTIYGRQLKITDYADDYTRSQLGNKLERTLLLVKSDGIPKLADILCTIGEAQDLEVVAIRMIELSAGDVNELACDVNVGKAVAVEIVGPNAIAEVHALAGPADSSKARSEASGSIRARFGTDASSNAVHVSESESDATHELKFFFEKRRGRTCSLMTNDSVLCVVKPSYFMRSGVAIGTVLKELARSGYAISGLSTRTLNRSDAQEFLEVYKGVVQEYLGMVDELTSGPCVALEITGTGARENFRSFCGPSDPAIAKQLRPDTLRAKFGVDKVNNAVHCTDLPEDIPLELEYFFQILG
eukprot:m.99134 g.99134  ORF g.99134 m.99134 type:complete len:362 (-) comp27131_c0_seq1:55-1140(-)